MQNYEYCYGMRDQRVIRTTVLLTAGLAGGAMDEIQRRQCQVKSGVLLSLHYSVFDSIPSISPFGESHLFTSAEFVKTACR